MAQNNLNSFLALAEDLEIKGLTQNNGGPANTQTVKPSEVRGRRAASASNTENSDDIMEIKSEAAPSQAAVSYSEDYQDQDPAYFDTHHHPGEENTYQTLDTSQGETPRQTGDCSTDVAYPSLLCHRDSPQGKENAPY